MLEPCGVWATTQMSDCASASVAPGFMQRLERYSRGLTQLPAVLSTGTRSDISDESAGFRNPTLRAPEIREIQEMVLDPMPYRVPHRYAFRIRSRGEM